MNVSILIKQQREENAEEETMMEKKSSHCFNYMIIMKFICFVIMLIGSCKMRVAFAVTAIEQSSIERGYSVASVPSNFNESTPRAATTSTVDFDVLNANAVDGAPLNGWRCHCWNSTNGLEVYMCTS